MWSEWEKKWQFRDKRYLYMILNENLTKKLEMEEKMAEELRTEGISNRFIQIPGPNPILVPGNKKEWDGGVIEACNVFKDQNIYYLYYHGTPKDEKLWSPSGYRIGVATAFHPLGPWTKYEKNPIIDIGPKGSWEDCHAACAAIIKEKGDKYYMWYSGCKEGEHPKWSIGFATASNPLGPWKKHEANPILEDFGYVGGVVKVKGKYYMYSEYPIDPQPSDKAVITYSPDEGPIALATAEKPEGPWTKYKGNPVISPDDWGSWDDGGFSEAGVMYHDGVFHIFYSGTKWRKLESIGYAYSHDGYNFTKYTNNPVALRERNPDASAFAETHAFWEPPFIYLFHTLRYISRGGMYNNEKVVRDEDIGVQILATATPFRLTMPVLYLSCLNPGAPTLLKDCVPISLQHISEFSLTIECTYHTEAKAGLKVYIKASYDGINYDTENLCTFDISFAQGKKITKTAELSSKVMFIKVLAKNLDKTQDITNLNITATLGHA